MTTTPSASAQRTTQRTRRPWRSRLAAAALALPIALAGIAAASPPPAAAANNPYSAVQVCNAEAPGSGYYVQRTFDLGRITAYQLYNGTYNCAVSLKNSYIGTVEYPDGWIQICLQASGSSRVCDSGNYRYYAGAVWTYGKGACVRVTYGAGRTNVGDVATSSWANCG